MRQEALAPRSLTEPYRLYRANAQCFDAVNRLQSWASMAFAELEFLGAEHPADQFQGEAVWVQGKMGEFCTYSGSSYTARGRARHARDASLMVVFVQKGSLEIHTPAGVRRVFQGELVAFPCLTQYSLHWRNAQETHVLIPAEHIHHSVDQCPQAKVSSLDACAIAPFLRNHLALLARSAERMGSLELAGVLDPVLSLAKAAWFSACRTDPLPRVGASLYDAALGLIEVHCHRSDFTVAALVRALGCSRAKLYRVFAQRTDSVHAALRNARLERARQLIEAGDLDTPIGTLAYACGFVDQSTFGKMFRRRFGVAPGQWRRHVISRHQALEPVVPACQLSAGR